jgi:hypothetical protein
MSVAQLGLPEALERAASALPGDADEIRPANGDPVQLRRSLDDEAACRVLSWLLQHEPASGGELAGAWAEDSEDGARLLLRIDPEGLPKVARKALRRVIHQLKSRGVALPEAPRTEVVSTLPPIDESIDEARITPIDPSGARLVYVALDNPSGGVRLFVLVLDDERGITEFEVYNSGRRHARKFLRDFEKQEGLSGVVAPPQAVRALIARCAREHPADRPLPTGFSEWRSRLGDAAEGTPTPGDLAREALPIADDDRPERLERAVELVSTGVIGPWVPRGAALERLAEKLGEIEQGVIIVSGSRRKEQVRQTMDDALSEIFSDAAGVHAAQRFEESAYVLWKAGPEDDARACLAAARAYREVEPQANPVARAALDRMLGPLLERLESESAEAKDEEGSSLLVEP